MAHLVTNGHQLQPRCTCSIRMGLLQSPVMCRSAVPSGTTCKCVRSKTSVAVCATSALAEAAAVEVPKRRRRRAPFTSHPDVSDSAMLGLPVDVPSTDDDSRPAAGAITDTAAARARRSRRASNNNSSAPSATMDTADVHTDTSPGDDAAAATPHASSQQHPTQSLAPSVETTTAQLTQIEHSDTLLDLQQIAASFSQHTSPAVLALAIKRCLKVPAEDGQQEIAVAQLLEQLWQLQQAQLEGCNRADLALMIRALCRAPHDLREQYEPAVIQQLVPQFLQLLSTASAKDIAVVLHALSIANLQLSADDMQTVVSAFIAVLHDAVPQSVCLVLWGASSMNFRIHPQQMQQILGAFEQMLPARHSVNFAQVALRKLGLSRQAAGLGQRLQTTQHMLSQELDPALLTQLICDCRHTAAILRLATEHSSALGPVHIATAMQQVVKLARRGSSCHHMITDEAFDQLWMQQQAQLDSCDPATLATMMQTFMLAPNSVMQQHHGAVLQHLLPALLHQLPSASADTVAKTLKLLAEHVASNSSEPTGRTIDLSNAVLLLVQHFLARGRQAAAVAVAKVYCAAVQLGVQLQQDQLQQLFDLFMSKNPPVRSEKQVVQALVCSGLQEEAKRLQEKLLQLRGPRWLTTTINTAGQPELLQWLLDNHAAMFNQTHVAAAISQAVKLHHNNSSGNKEQEKVLQRLLNQLWQLQEPQLQSCCTETLASMVRTFCLGPAVIQRQFWPAITQQLVPAMLQKPDQQQAGACAAAAYAVVAAADQQQLQLDDQQVRQLLDVLYLERKWQWLDAESLPQVLWAAAKVDYSIPGQVVQHQVDRVLHSLQDAAPAADSIGASAIARLVWSVAASGRQLPTQQTQQLLYLFYKDRKLVAADTVASVLWGVAKMGETPSLQQVQQLLTAFVNKLQSASFAAVADVAWACGHFGYLRKDYLSHPTVLGAIPTAPAQQVAQLAWACGELGYYCEPLLHAVMQRILQLQRDSPVQAVVDISWAVAVLDLQQYAAEVVQLIGVISEQWGSGAPVTGHDTTPSQLYQVHLWLQDSQLAGGQGLLCALTPQQLQDCQEAHRDVLTAAAVNAEPWLLLSMFVAVQQLPMTWQEPPQFQQYSRDGVVILDISARTAQGEQLALFVDEAESFSQPDGLPMGRVLFRDRLLAARGYRVVSISAEIWRQLEGQQEQQHQYLLQLLTGQDTSTSEGPLLQQDAVPAQQTVEQSNPGQADPSQARLAAGSKAASRVLHNSRQARRVRRSTVNKGRVSEAEAL